MNKEQEIITMLRSCEALILMERYDEAEQLYRELQALSPYDSLMGRALVAHKKGEFQRVVELSSAALELSTDSTEALMSRGQGHLALGELPHAIADFKKAYEAAPQSSIAAHGLGLALARDNQNEAAERLLEKAHRAAPETVQFGLDLAKVKLRLLKVEDALDTLKNVLGAAPERPEAYLEIAAILSSTGQREAAYEILDIAQRLAHIDDPELLHQLAKLATLLELKDAALAALERLDKVVQESPEGLCEMGNLALAAKSIPTALEYLDRALRLDGGYGPAYYSMAVCFDALNDSEQAEKALRLSAKLQQDWKSYNNLAALLLDRGEDTLLDEVKALIDQAEAATGETRPEILMNKALYLRRVGDEKTADLLLRALLESTPAGSKLREQASHAVLQLRREKVH